MRFLHVSCIQEHIKHNLLICDDSCKETHFNWTSSFNYNFNTSAMKNILGSARLNAHKLVNDFFARNFRFVYILARVQIS